MPDELKTCCPAGERNRTQKAPAKRAELVKEEAAEGALENVTLIQDSKIALQIINRAMKEGSGANIFFFDQRRGQINAGRGSLDDEDPITICDRLLESLAGYRKKVEAVERMVYTSAHHKFRGNIKEIMKYLGVGERRAYRAMKRFNLPLYSSAYSGKKYEGPPPGDIAG